MLFGRRKPGYTTTVDGSVDPEQAVLELQKAELAAKKKPKAEVFDIDAASETARRLKETGSTFDGSAAKTGEDVIAAVERETAELAAKQAAEAAPEAAEAAQPNAAKPELLDFLASEPEAENDPFADQPTKTAPELPELTPAQELAGYIRARSAAALITPHALLLEEVENADELLAQMPADPQCTDIVTRAGAKDTYYYSNAKHPLASQPEHQSRQHPRTKYPCSNTGCLRRAPFSAKHPDRRYFNELQQLRSDKPKHQYNPYEQAVQHRRRTGKWQLNRHEIAHDHGQSKL